MISKVIRIFVFFLIYVTTISAQNPQVIQLMNQVNKDSIALYIRQLSGDTSCVISGAPYTILSRHKNQPGNEKAANYIYEKFQSWGYQVQYETFSSTGKNVVATKQGTGDSQAYFVVCGHYDDMPSGTVAPGADDNASGTATVLELARVFSKFNSIYTIKFICFDEEEQGLIGSNYYATQARNRNDSIIGVINLDMTGYDSNNDGIVDVHSKNVANTQQIANEWVNNIYQYGVSLSPRIVPSQPYSDHHSFHLKNYGAILVIEYDYDFNPRYHTVNDKFQYLNMDFAHKIAQVTAATAAEYVQILSSNVVNLFTHSGWNLISLPIQPLDGRRSVLFPTATSLAYTYDNSYVTADTLRVGKGYWLKFNSNQQHQIQGQIVNQLQIPVKTGWNLIGSLHTNIPVSLISTQPPNIVSSLFYEYSGSYSPVNNLSSGKGYWVKASQNGFINLTSNFAKNVDHENPLIQNYDYELKFISGNSTATLYLAYENSIPDKFELPPVPPSGGLDVRFANNSFVEKSNDEEKVIFINSYDNQVVLSLNSKQNIPLIVKYYVDGLETEILISNGEQIKLNENVKALKVKKVHIPEKFVLFQNFPNPFNPVTKIQFNLPERMNIKLNLYDIKGKLLEVLIDKSLNAGLHSYNFDGSKYPSGVYFYELKSEKYRSIRKMILVK